MQPSDLNEDDLCSIAEERGQSPDLVLAMDELCKAEGGPGVAASYRSPICAFCGGDASVFSDDLSRAEYRISRTCQTCQDEMFAEPDE